MPTETDFFFRALPAAADGCCTSGKESKRCDYGLGSLASVTLADACGSLRTLEFDPNKIRKAIDAGRNAVEREWEALEPLLS